MKNELEVLERLFLSHNLSQRQQDVAHLVIKGMNVKEMAKEMHIQEKTVKFHLTSVFLKMQVSSKYKLMHKCYRAIFDQMRF